jgi:hypothetical protein
MIKIIILCFILLYFILFIIIGLLFYRESYGNYNIKIHEPNINNGPNNVPGPGYNLGDLLNMGRYTFGWPDTHGRMDIYPSSCAHYKDTILDYYCTSRNEENNLESYPNVKRIRNSVNKWHNINKHTYRELINIVTDDSTLCIHIRSGDKGIIEDEFLNVIINLSNYYSTFFIMSGIHADTSSATFELSKNNLEVTLDIIKNKINKEIIINLDKADIHVSLMSIASNLLLHKGGFSLLGGLIFSGKNLYCTKLLGLNYYHTEYIDSLKVKIKIWGINNFIEI